MRTVLTIAGSDSGGGAGIQADLKTFAAFGVYGTSVVTAVTAQNTRGVVAGRAIDVDMVVAQIEAVASDFAIAATKIGMLANTAIVEAVADAIARLSLPAVVLDPVMVAKSGDHLLDPSAVAALRDKLIPLAAVLTPNIPEAEALTGLAITSIADQRQAAARLIALGAPVVVIKGGHLPGRAVDVWSDGTRVIELDADRIDTPHTHGTGCTFSSALAACLALGHDPEESARRAKAYIIGAIRHAPGLGHGHGPLHHFWMQDNDR